MRSVILVIVLGCLASPTSADESLAEVFVKRCEANRTTRIASTKTELAKKQRQLALERKGAVNRGQTGTRSGNNYITFPSPEAKKNAIAESMSEVAELTQQLEVLERGSEAALPLCVPVIGKLELGAIGTFKVGKVVDVVDQNQVIVAFARFSAPRTVVRGGALATSDGSRLDDLVVWLKGVSTAGMTTDGRADLTTTVFRVTGTTTYDSEEGAATVFVLEPFDLEPVKTLWKERHAKP